MSDAQVLVGRYRLIRELGAGAMGTVWLALDTTLNRQVAVKRVTDPLTPQLGRQAEMARLRAMREGRVAARLSHPNAVGIYDVAIHDGQPWLVMEYVPSRTLTDIVQTHGPIPPQRAAVLGTQIASALAEAHRVGIVHRDVKPSNLLLTEEGEAKLTDFGIARSGGDATLTASGLVTGTPAYFAPELARGADPTSASDVWSLGATLYFAVEGTPPFGNDDNPLVLLGRVANQPVPRPARAGELTATIMRLLDREPVRRPSMVQARSMLAALSKGTETIPLALLQEELDTEQDDEFASTREFPEVTGDGFATTFVAPDVRPEPAISEPAVEPAATELVEAEPDTSEVASEDTTADADRSEPAEHANAEADDSGHDETEVDETEVDDLVDESRDVDEPAPNVSTDEGTAPNEPDTDPDTEQDADQRTPTPAGADDDPDETVSVSAAPAATAATVRHESADQEPRPSDGEEEEQDEERNASEGNQEPPRSAPAEPEDGDDQSVGDAVPPVIPVPPDPHRRRRRTRVLLALVLAALGSLGTYLVATAATSGGGTPDTSERADGGRSQDADDADRTSDREQGSDRSGNERGRKQEDPTPRRSETPSPTPTPSTPDPKPTDTGARMTATAMRELVARYYDQLPSNTDAGWRMLGPELRSQGRDTYDGWWGLVRSVEVGELRADPADKTVTGSVTFVMNEGNTETERHVFGLVKSDDGKRLLINTDDRL